MNRKLNAKVKAGVKVYLIPKDELKIENGKPVLSDKYLVYEKRE